MIKTLILIVSGILISACKQTENKTATASEETKKDSLKTENPMQAASADSRDLLELFSKKREEVVLKLKSISAEEANALYEKYYEDNGYLVNQIAEK